MRSYLKSQGYKYTKNETLGNREFREVGTLVEIDEDLSTFAEVAYLTTETYELFLEDKTYSIDKIKDILGDLRDEDGLVNGEASIEEQEQGYLITLTFTTGA